MCFILINGGIVLTVNVKKTKKKAYKKVLFYIILGLCFAASILFVNNNHSFYDRPIAEVVKTELVETVDLVDVHNNKDQLFTQHITAKLKNGEEKGQLINLSNEYSLSGAYDQQYHIGNNLFVSIGKKDETGFKGLINDVKRDQYLLIITWIFIFVLLVVGKKQGLFSIISLAVNAVLLWYALDVYVNNENVSLLVVAGISVILFTIISLLLVNGFNEKTYAAIVVTILGTFVSLLIAYIVLWLTSENGLRYEEMQYLTRPYRTVFLAGLFIGSLGAVMDVAITMSSSIFELYEKNNDITPKALKQSGLNIGKDIMGTMTNILFFAYISGSIPVLILYLKNNVPMSYSLSMNLSLELARALAGGIGIVLAIPIGLYISIFYVNRKRAKL